MICANLPSCRGDHHVAATAAVMIVQTEGSVGAVINSVRMNTIGQPGQYLKMGVLALLYTLQVQWWCYLAGYALLAS